MRLCVLVHKHAFYETYLNISRVIFRAFLLLAKVSKNSIFNWVSKLNLDHQTFLNSTKIFATLLQVIFSNVYIIISNSTEFLLISQNITTCSRLLDTWILCLQAAFLPLYFSFQANTFITHSSSFLFSCFSDI